MHRYPKRIRWALAISVGLHIFVFGALLTWLSNRTNSGRSPTILQIDTSVPDVPEPRPVSEQPSKPVSMPAPPVAPTPTPIPVTPEPLPMPPSVPAEPEAARPLAPPAPSEVESVDSAPIRQAMTPPIPHPEVQVSSAISSPPKATFASSAITSAPPTSASYRRNPQPLYPASARRLRQQGQVLLTVQVDAKGHPTQVKLKTSSGFPLLDTAAQKAVWRWEFVSAKVNNQPVPSEVEVPIVFKLTD